MSRSKITNASAAFAVAIAFLTGLIGSLALRPAGGSAVSVDSGSAGEVARRVHWRLPLSFQTTMPVLGDNPIYVTESLRTASGGAVDIRLFEPGEVVPAFGISEAVRDGKIEAGYTWLGYDQGRIPSAALLAAVPFGMEPWEYAAWWFDAGGEAVGRALYARHNTHIIFCGLTGPETAGWFREPVTSLLDVQGLKIRFAGIGGKVIERTGASVTMLPGGEIFQALEKGAIDATEYALPIVDQALGFNRVATYNYYPGWHQPSTASHMVVNMDVWNQTSPADRTLIETACTAGVLRNLARSEALQGAVIAGFPDVGVTAETLPDDVLRELERITEIGPGGGSATGSGFRRDPGFAERLPGRLCPLEGAGLPAQGFLMDEPRRIESSIAGSTLDLPQTRLSRAVDPWLVRIGHWSSWLWLILVAIIVVNVILRYAFGEGRIEFEEIQWHIYAAGFLLGLGYALQADAHIRVDVLHERFPPESQGLDRAVRPAAPGAAVHSV